jgi:hypothetical protein
MRALFPAAATASAADDVGGCVELQQPGWHW